MSNMRLEKLSYWGFNFTKNAPNIILDSGSLFFRRNLLRQKPDSTKLLVGTHHKVLTVFLGRVFRCFAIASGRTAVQGKGAQIDYTKDILLDHHSQYDLTKLNDAPYVGIHVIRDPRDLLVSCAFYHQKSAERWLHVPQDRLGGKTYQQHVNDLPTMEARLLFELENSGGENLRDMLAWDRTNQNFSELRYEDLIGPRSVDLFEQAIMHWPLSAGERAILMQFYRYFSLTGPGVKGNKHVRNPTSGQWRNHFTPAVEREFHTMFPNSINDLEYEA